MMKAFALTALSILFALLSLFTGALFTEASAAEVGDKIPIPRASIKCVEQSRPCSYCYGDPFSLAGRSETITILSVDHAIDEVSSFVAHPYRQTCSQISSLLGSGPFVEAVILRKIVDVVSPSLRLTTIDLQLGRAADGFVLSGSVEH